MSEPRTKAGKRLLPVVQQYIRSLPSAWPSRHITAEEHIAAIETEAVAAEPEGLDVERLARAERAVLRRRGLTPNAADEQHISDIAVEYARQRLDARAERLPWRPIGYTAEECERDMRRMTNGERGCANPDEHVPGSDPHMEPRE